MRSIVLPLLVVILTSGCGTSAAVAPETKFLAATWEAGFGGLPPLELTIMSSREVHLKTFERGAWKQHRRTRLSESQMAALRNKVARAKEAGPAGRYEIAITDEPTIRVEAPDVALAVEIYGPGGEFCTDPETRPVIELWNAAMRAARAPSWSSRLQYILCLPPN